MWSRNTIISLSICPVWSVFDVSLKKANLGGRALFSTPALPVTVKPVLSGHSKRIPTRNCVYETLCPQPLACPPSCSPGNLFTILLQLTKSEATSFNSFRDIFIGSFRCPNLQRALIQKNAKVITKYGNFQQVIYSLPSISCPTLELPAVTVFEISSFLCPNLQRAITKKK